MNKSSKIEHWPVIRRKALCKFWEGLNPYLIAKLDKKGQSSNRWCMIWVMSSKKFFFLAAVYWIWTLIFKEFCKMEIVYVNMNFMTQQAHCLYYSILSISLRLSLQDR